MAILILKTFIRNILRPIYYYLYYVLLKKTINTTRDGKPLKKGITAVVAMKNEEYTLPLCLQSLVGFADQVVIIDNGSEDASLIKAKEFKAKYAKEIIVDIIEMPGALLGDCREAGLKTTNFQWHLRWDADMVAHTTGNNDMKQLRNKVLNDDVPKAIQLPRINIFGDLHHTMGAVKDPGEPILIWFNKHVYYKEFGKFDSIKVPYYFQQVAETQNYYFHCSGLKSDENLIHRFHYFTWREFYNKYTDGNRPALFQDFEQFKKIRNEYLLGTTNKPSIQYRYMRQLVSQFVKFDTQQYGDYPTVLQQEITNKNSRFQIIYADNKPFIRIDNLDEEMKSYNPTEEDVNWDMSNFFTKLFAEKPEVYF